MATGGGQQEFAIAMVRFVADDRELKRAQDAAVATAKKGAQDYQEAWSAAFKSVAREQEASLKKTAAIPMAPPPPPAGGGQQFRQPTESLQQYLQRLSGDPRFAQQTLGAASQQARVPAAPPPVFGSPSPPQVFGPPSPPSGGVVTPFRVPGSVPPPAPGGGGPGVGGPVVPPTPDPDPGDAKKKKLRTLQQEYRQLQQVITATSGGLLGELAPGLAQVVLNTGNAAREARNLGVRLGSLLIVGTAVSSIFTLYAQSLREARERTIAAGQAVRNLDFGAATGNLEKAIGEIDKLNQLQKESLEGPGRAGGPPPFQAFLANIELLFSKGIKARIEEATQRAKEFVQLFQDVELPKLERQSRTEELSAERARLQLATQGAETEAERTRILDQQKAVVQGLSDVAIAGLRAEAELRAVALENKAKETGLSDLNNVAAQIREQAERRVGAAVAATAVEMERLTLETAQANAEARALAAEELASSLERARDVRQAQASAAQAILESERSIAEGRAQFLGQATAGLEAFQGKRRAIVQQEVQDELTSLAEVAKARQEALQARLGGAQGNEAVRIRQQLAALGEQVAADRSKLLARQAAEESALRAKELAETRAHRQAQLKEETDYFELRKQLNQTTVAEELGQLERLTRDERATVDQRRRAQVELVQQRKAVDQEYFDLLKAAGLTSLADELRRQAQLVAAAKEGSRERLAAEKEFFDKQKQLRDAAATAGQGLLGLGAARLREQGQEDFTREEALGAAEEARQQAQQTFGKLGGGGRISGEEFAAAGQAADVFAKLRDTGVSASQALGELLSKSSRDLAGQFVTGTQAVAGFASALQAAAGVLGGGGRIGGAGGGGVPLPGVAGPPGLATSFAAPGSAPTVFQGADVDRALQDLVGAMVDSSKANAELRAAQGFQRSLEGNSAEAGRNRAVIGTGAMSADQLSGDFRTDEFLRSSKEISQGYGAAFEESLGMADKFLGDFQSRIDAGNSKVANSLVDFFMTQVIRRLEEEARRS